MLKIFLSSTYQDLGEARSEILKQIDSAFAGVGMEDFIPDGTSSHENCISELKKSKIVIFLLSSNYGSLIDTCKLKEGCKADCIMKKGEGEGHRISYTHCEYKTTIAEGILHQTYKVLDGWDTQVRPETKQFEKEFSEEMWTRIPDINDPTVVPLICKNLATKIVKWHTDDELDFKKFVDREKVLNSIIDNIDSKVEVWGTGGVGKTALIEVALLVQKLKGQEILTIGTTKTYTSGSGLEYFSKKGADDQYITESKNKITIYDVINAFTENGLLPNAEEVNKLPREKQIEVLTQKIRTEKDLILFVDDFHLATEDVVNMAKSVDHLILSSRKNTGIARKEIYLSGIDEEDREDLINLFHNVQEEQLPENVKKQIAIIAEGHPVSTEILVKNYQRISNFDKLKGFNLENANQMQVNDFFRRVIEEIFSGNEAALELLKHLSVINTDLETNIHRESVEKSYLDEDIQAYFNELIDTGMLKKKKGFENDYEFYFKHIQDYLEDEAQKESHEKATEYYERKREIFGELIDEAVEVLYHKAKSNPNEELVEEILEIKKKIQPVHYGFKRLIDVGEELKSLLRKENKAHILKVLGNLYSDLGRFEEAEHAYTGALVIYRELADKNPDAYNPDVAMTQNNLGTLYAYLRWFEEAENAYTEALKVRRELSNKNPDAYNQYVAATQNNLGILYRDLGRFEEAEHAYLEALKIRKELADKNPDVYNPDMARVQNNLGTLYADLRRFEEAEHAYKKTLEIFRELADKNPDEYISYVASVQNNLGVFYWKLGRSEEAEHAYTEALEISRELADKNPDAYNPAVAMAQNNLGNFYRDLGRFEEAEHAYTEALKVRRELADKNPDAYKSEMGRVHHDLGNFYRDLERFEEAEHELKEALDVYKNLADKNPDAYNQYVAATQNNLGIFYRDLGRFEEAEHELKEALKVRRELA
ncbi:MAG: tetratricopeptide repeat protein, partial [Promethearchaeota archaeon]